MGVACTFSIEELGNKDNKKRYEMYINEAIEKALEVNGILRRKSVTYSENCRFAVIKPSLRTECCDLVMCHNGKFEVTRKMWKPTAEDLQANDWEVLKVSD